MTHTINTKVLFATMLYMITSLLAISPANAMIEQKSTNVVKVTFADLDLAKEAGIESLYHRLQIAARKACGSRDTRVRDLRDNRLRKACYKEALNEAVEKVGNAQLTALHTQ